MNNYISFTVKNKCIYPTVIILFCITLLSVSQYHLFVKALKFRLQISISLHSCQVCTIQKAIYDYTNHQCIEVNLTNSIYVEQIIYILHVRIMKSLGKLSNRVCPSSKHVLHILYMYCIMCTLYISKCHNFTCTCSLIFYLFHFISFSLCTFVTYERIVNVVKPNLTLDFQFTLIFVRVNRADPSRIKQRETDSWLVYFGLVTLHCCPYIFDIDKWLYCFMMKVNFDIHFVQYNLQRTCAWYVLMKPKTLYMQTSRSCESVGSNFLLVVLWLSGRDNRKIRNIDSLTQRQFANTSVYALYAM